MIKNFYTANVVQSSDEGLYIVKVMVDILADQVFYTLYRCSHQLTPNQSALTDNHGVPQGDRIYGSLEQLEAMASLLFPIIIQCGGRPSPASIL